MQLRLIAATCLFLSSLFLDAGTASGSDVDTVKQLSSSLWRPHLPRCSYGGGSFPSKMHANGVCDDRDSVIFNGLLCYSGEAEACNAVLNSQDKAPLLPKRGAWWRSPRIADDSSIPRSDSFSADQNLGVLLTVATLRNQSGVLDRLSNWMNWIDANRPCAAGSEPLCVRGWPRFCRDDTEKGCSLRPGDIAMLQTFFSRMGLEIPEGLFMRDLFMRFHELSTLILLADAHVNDLNYPVHLVAVGITVLRSFASAGDAFILGEAAKVLNRRQPRNAFFAYVAGKSKEEVAGLVLGVCPTAAAAMPSEKTEWIWERPDGSDAPKSTMLWDCVFMANLLARP